MKSHLIVSTLVVLWVVIACCFVTVQAQPSGDASSNTGCEEVCEDPFVCKDGRCVCPDGLYEIPESHQCVKSVCDPPCQVTANQICDKSACICADGFENSASGGNLNCTHAPSTQSSSTTVITTTPLITTTQNTTSHKPSTTTKSPLPTTKKPQHKKSGMSKWTITGIIVLITLIAGFGGFMIYRHKRRATYRATSTAAR